MNWPQANPYERANRWLRADFPRMQDVALLLYRAVGRTSRSHEHPPMLLAFSSPLPRNDLLQSRIAAMFEQLDLATKWTPKKSFRD